jgi:hypothetical protein
MTREIRTDRGKLIGKFDEQTSSFIIKDGNKVTKIIIPPEGLKLIYTPGDGITEEVYIS